MSSLSESGFEHGCGHLAERTMQAIGAGRRTGTALGHALRALGFGVLVLATLTAAEANAQSTAAAKSKVQQSVASAKSKAQQDAAAAKSAAQQRCASAGTTGEQCSAAAASAKGNAAVLPMAQCIARAPSSGKARMDHIAACRQQAQNGRIALYNKAYNAKKSVATASSAVDPARAAANAANAAANSTRTAANLQDEKRQQAEAEATAALTEGSNKLTLADQNEQGTSAAQLQARQQVGTTALSLANQKNSPQSKLRLF